MAIGEHREKTAQNNPELTDFGQLPEHRRRIGVLEQGEHQTSLLKQGPGIVNAV